jgi:hypothetical protein
MVDTAAVRRAWSDYASGLTAIDGEHGAAAAVDGQLRRACLRQVLGGFDAAACRRTAAGGWWTEDTTAMLATLASVHVAETDVAAARTAMELGALLAARLRNLPWDVVFSAAERFVWLLPAEERGGALRTFAVAHAILPLPRWETAAARAAQEQALALVRSPSLEREGQFLQASCRVDEGEVRSDLLLHAVPLLTGERRHRALQEALAGAFEFPAGEIHRGQVVAAVVLRDPPALLGDTLQTVRASWDDEDDRTELLFELGRTLPPEQLGPIVEEAAALEDEWGRVTVLAALRPRLPAGLRDRWQQVADAMRDESLKGMLEPVPAEPPAVPGEERALDDALRAWQAAAGPGGDEPRSVEIARGVGRFVEASTALYDAHREL